jgi:hypothetical protein
VNKTKTLGVGLFLLVLVLVVGYLTLIKPATNKVKPGFQMNRIAQDAKESESKPAETTDKFAGNGSIIDLFKKGKNLKCVVTAKLEDNSIVKQDMYISGEKMRMDFVTSAQLPEGKKEIESHMISDKDTAYIWTSMDKNGSKMTLTQVQSSEGTPADSASKGDYEEFKKPVDYTCEPWLIVDNSKFEIPSDITFTDITAQLKNLQNQLKTPDLTQNACKACDSLGNADMVAKCKQQAGCK